MPPLTANGGASTALKHDRTSAMDALPEGGVALHRISDLHGGHRFDALLIMVRLAPRAP